MNNDEMPLEIMYIKACNVLVTNHVNAVKVSFAPAGKDWSEKVGFVRNHLSAANVTALVVTGLDETACEYSRSKYSLIQFTEIL